MRLVAVLLADLLRIGGELELVARDRVQELVGDGYEREREPERRRQLAHLGAVADESESPGAVERLLDGVGPGMGIPVHVAADPGAEPDGKRGARDRAAVGGDELLGCVEKALLEKPQSVADLVDHARTLGTHLVGLPEDGDLLRCPLHHALAGVELGQEIAESRLRVQDGAARGLGRVCGEHELERDMPRHLAERSVVDPGLAQATKRIREGLARNALLALDVPATTDSMVLLGDVGELKEEREGPQDLRLLLEVELADRPRKLGADRRVAALARAPRHPADLLLAGEQLLPLLLHHDPPQQHAE